MRSLLVAALLVACASDPVAPRDCTPGATNVCACPGGPAGVQTCTAAGTLGACACPDAGGLSDVVDAGPPEDRPAPIDSATAPDVVDAGAGLDVVDAGPARDVVDAGTVAADIVDVGTADVRVDCNGPVKQTCRTNSDCQTQCLPTMNMWLWCCTLGGQCFATSRNFCPN